MTSRYTIFPLGDSALTIEWGNVIDAAINREVLALFQQLKSLSLPYLTDLVPAYSSLSVHYDPVAVRRMMDKEDIDSDGTAFETVSEIVRQVLAQEKDQPDVATAQHIRVPVCYASRYAPDLEAVAAEKGLTASEIVRLHTAGTYHVYMLGFLPGFAYMGEVDERIAIDRKAAPQPVAAGAVGIAGRQTGIYPLASPGGWQIIGRTPLKLFHRKSDHPVLFAPGDTITFYAITEHEFAHY
jgi:inhibitor of KinA